MSARITEVIFDKRTVPMSPVSELRVEEKTYPDGRTARAFIIPNDDDSMEGLVDPYRYRLDREEATAKGMRAGDYALTVGKKKNEDDIVVVFNIHARGSQAFLGQAEFRLADYIDSAVSRLPDGAAGNAYDIIDEEEDEREYREIEGYCADFIKEKLVSLLDANELFFRFMAASLDTVFAPDIVRTLYLKNGKPLREVRLHEGADPDVFQSFGFDG